MEISTTAGTAAIAPPILDAPTWVVIPTYNERDNLPRLVGEVLALSPTIHVLIVDDASPDGTGAVADDLCREDPDRVEAIHRVGKLGLGTAYLEGFGLALARGARFVVEMDADFSHRPEDLPRLLRAAQGGVDLVIGSRNVPGGRAENWSLLRHAISRAGSFYARVILGTRVRDCTSGFRCFRGEALRKMGLGQVRSTGFGFQVEMLYLAQLAGLRTEEVWIVFPDRASGTSKMSWRIALEAFLLVPRLRWIHGRRPGLFPQGRARRPARGSIRRALGRGQGEAVAGGAGDIWSPND